MIKYPMSPLSEAGYRHSRQRILSSTPPIKTNGGKCRYEDMDENAGRSGADWAKPLLKSTSSKWSSTRRAGERARKMRGQRKPFAKLTMGSARKNFNDGTQTFAIVRRQVA